MRFNRSLHRWTSISFVAVVLFVTLAAAMQTQQAWIYYLPLPFLLVLTISGLFLFFRPYLRRAAS